MNTRILYALVSLVFVYGCATAPHAGQKTPGKTAETPQEIQEAVGSVVNSVSGTKVTAKYCPLCGKHYGGKIVVCPADAMLLKEVEE